MALIICPECNKQVSDRANSCPNCGFPISEYIFEKNQNEEKARIEEYLLNKQDYYSEYFEVTINDELIRFDRNALICAKIGFDYSILGPWVSRRTEDIVYDKISELIDDNDISFDSSKYYDFLKRWPYTIIEVIKKSTIEEYKKIIKDKDDHTIPGVASIENAIQYVDDSEFINLLEGKIRVEIEESEYKESALYDKYVNHQSSFEFSLPKIQNVYANTIGGGIIWFGQSKLI